MGRLFSVYIYGAQLRQLPPDVAEQPGMAWALVYKSIFEALMYGCGLFLGFDST